jgi:Zn-dependent membrane protease YugP
MGIYVIMGVFALLSWLVSSRLKSKFEFYSRISLRNGMSGAEIAEKMLHDHGIYDVQIISTPGQLTDHYNPSNKTVNLSEVVYNERNAAAAAVAAHEVGHAIQHATAYKWLGMRSKLVPMVGVSSRFSQILLMAGLAIAAANSMGIYVAMAGVVLFGITTLFTVVTLPVEYDASNRALDWLKNKNMLGQEEYDGAEDALKWASRTYLVAALGSIAQLLYYVVMILNRRNSRDN